MKTIFKITCLLMTGSMIQALSFDGVDERYQCDQFPVQSGLDDAWVASVDKWYIPLWNKVEFYHNAQQFYGNSKFNQLSQKDLDNTCATYRENGTSVTFSAFGDQQLEYHAYPDPIRAGIYYWSAPDQTGKYEYVATSYTTFSDNANYVVTVCLWNDGRKGFTVGSPKSALDAQSFKQVKKHLRQIGFSSKYFVQYSYEKCNI
ncbi:uncharacterized protein LOC110843012 [Folsomia candida]|uniref:uncharacterized protein LOC110843012 n=1 Tax=Folsomia candida TaxID=158441 RepID=UPI000B8F8ED3|nr:uncharacterized protein LOC110843012 [Folsomia candida]